MVGIILIVFLVALVLGLPIAIAIALSSVIPNLIGASLGTSGAFVVRSMISGANSFTILALPLFMLSGEIMSRGGISKKLFDVFALIVGKKTAGLPCAAILTCLFFGMISGSGPATCAAVGSMVFPLLLGLGYDKIFVGALVSTAAGLAVIIPPSIPYITICSVTGASIGDMMIGGIIPGFLIAFFLMGWTFIYCKIHGEDKSKIAANYQQLKSKGVLFILKDAFWALLFPVIVLGGIYGGLATPTEVACLSVAYALIVSLFIYRTISWRDVPRFFQSAVRTYSPLCILLAVACAFARVLTKSGAPQQLAEAVTGVIHNRYILILLVVIILFIMGMFIDVGPANVILAPIFLPIARAYGFQDIHFLMIMVCCLAIGFVTPPFGMNLFVAAPMIEVSSLDIGKKAIPFIAANVLAVLLIALVPGITMMLIS